jgi:hypothetical protein
MIDGKIIAYGILGLGLIICLFLIYYIPRRKPIQSEHIEDYAKIRNKVTVRKDVIKEETDEDEGGGGSGFLGSIIGGFIAILIGTMLIGPISEQVKYATENISNNSTDFSSTMGGTLLSAVPAIFAFAILLIGITVAWGAMRTSGLV